MIYIYFISGVGIFLENRVASLESIKLLYFRLQLSISECIRERNLSYQKYFVTYYKCVCYIYSIKRVCSRRFGFTKHIYVPCSFLLYAVADLR